MMMRDLPCLPLVAERHINAVKATGEKYAYPEFDVYMFPQVWGSTALGFGGVGGQAITSAYTVVVEDVNEGFASVFFGNGLAYLIKNPNRTFYDDLAKWNMKPVAQAGAYRRKDDKTDVD